LNLTSSPAAGWHPNKAKIRVVKLKKGKKREKGICLCLGWLWERRRIPFSLELGGTLGQIAVEVDLTTKTTFIAAKGFLHIKKEQKRQKKEKATVKIPKSNHIY